ncbi:hypothetical protein JQ574_06620 [Bradyrhizobium sp. AUGA SZCCT0158]|uniref:hypothetical protein n=1 Tax=Bradyrhizobium sp. AUGA SZCCT0158 TaxID=2807661 RepID=UPI001BAD9051|nr:hypothetical protein [Bradyrhizobium sp. AUGA SZCCT0158]MBR1195695.1 hypothetical protein [Bradyrhizobium sp. AUGA SZCCT0158]
MARFDSLGGSAFFERQNFFYRAIPLLETTAPPLMEAVEALVSKGGNDLASNRPYEAFRNWCIADLTRAHAIVASARAGDPQAVAFVTFALTALDDSALARSFAEDFSDKRRLSALFALGRIKPVDLMDAENTVGVLLPFVDPSNDEAPRCNALMSLLETCKRFPDLGPVWVPKAIAAATVTPTPGLLFNMARAIWDYIELFDRTSLERALNALKATDPAMEGIIKQIDIALEKILATSNEDLAQDFLTEVIASGNGVDLEKFPSTKHNIANGDRGRLFKLLVRWLTSGDSNLEASSPKILSTGEPPIPFDTSTADLGLSEPDHIFLVHKAVGWLFMNNVAAASILVACLRGCDAATAAVISGLLFDPLLVNYGGKARDYLHTIKSGDVAYQSVKKALNAADIFLKGLRIDPPIKELRPSEQQLSVMRRHDYDWMRGVRKDAEKRSIFFGLVHRSIILYGRRSITFVREPDGRRRAVSMDMHSFSHAIELPRSEIVDPVGLSIAILSLRSASRK